MEDINNLIEEDPLLALEKVLTGVQSYSIETLLQELKTLIESLLDLEHLVSNQEFDFSSPWIESTSRTFTF